MNRRHLLRPQLSPATRAKASLAQLTARIEGARRRGDNEAVALLEKEKAWLTINSLVP